MIKAIKFGLRYASLIDDIVDFINLCKESGKDGKLNNSPELLQDFAPLISRYLSVGADRLVDLFHQV